MLPLGMSLSQAVAQLRDNAVEDGPSNPFHAAVTAPIDDQAAVNEWNQYIASQFPDGIPQSVSGQWRDVPAQMREIQQAIDQGYGTTGGRIRQVMRLAPMISDPARSHEVANTGRVGTLGFGIPQNNASRDTQLGLSPGTTAAAREWAQDNPLPNAGGFNDFGYGGSSKVVDEQLRRGLPLATAEYFGNQNTQGLIDSGFTPDGSGGLGALGLPLSIAGAAFGLPALGMFTGIASGLENNDPLAAIGSVAAPQAWQSLFGGAPASQSGPTVAPYGDNPIPSGSGLNWQDILAGGLLGAGVLGGVGGSGNGSGSGSSGARSGGGAVNGAGQGNSDGGRSGSGGGGSNLGLPSGDMTVNSEGLMNFGGSYQASPLQGPPRALRYFNLETNPYAPLVGNTYA